MRVLEIDNSFVHNFMRAVQYAKESVQEGRGESNKD